LPKSACHFLEFQHNAITMADQTPKDENPTTQQPVAPLAASIEVPPAAEEAPDPDEDDLSDLDGKDPYAP
jgi:hypothetical protein